MNRSSLRSNRLRIFFSLALALSIPKIARSQVRLYWEASPDGGRSWVSNAMTVDNAVPSVQLRVRALFPQEYFAFANANFDGVVTGVGGAGANDRADMFSRGTLTISGQTLVAQRSGDTLKIDDARDTLAPGAGPFWIAPGQSPGILGDVPDQSNPITLFTCRLLLDGSLGERDVNCILPSTPSLRVYTNGNGDSVTFAPSPEGVAVNVVPAPMTSPVLAAGLAACARRRRATRGAQG